MNIVINIEKLEINIGLDKKEIENVVDIDMAKVMENVRCGLKEAISNMKDIASNDSI